MSGVALHDDGCAAGFGFLAEGDWRSAFDRKGHLRRGATHPLLASARRSSVMARVAARRERHARPAGDPIAHDASGVKIEVFGLERLLEGKRHSAIS
jgi:hypothetical protein